MGINVNGFPKIYPQVYVLYFVLIKKCRKADAYRKLMFSGMCAHMHLRLYTKSVHEITRMKS